MSSGDSNTIDPTRFDQFAPTAELPRMVRAQLDETPPNSASAIVVLAPMETSKQINRSDRNLKPARPLPLPAQRTLKKLAEDINRARRRRRLSQKAVAERAGVGLSTVRRLEAGDPRIQLHVLARVLHLFGELGRLDALLDSGRDEIGLMLMDEQLPQRVRARKTKPTNAF